MGGGGGRGERNAGARGGCGGECGAARAHSWSPVSSMLYPGRGRGEIELGAVPPQDCEKCGCERPFRLCLLYAYERVLVIFGNLRGRSYLLICEVCGTPYEVPPRSGASLRGSNAIRSRFCTA